MSRRKNLKVWVGDEDYIPTNTIFVRTEHYPLHIDIVPGAAGKSAYQTWLEEGNEGSIEDFIAELHGGMRYGGKVQREEDLLEINPLLIRKGDLYYITETKSAWIWGGSEEGWTKIADYVDPTEFAQTKNKIDNHVDDKNNPHEVNKTQVGLGNVENYGVAEGVEPIDPDIGDKYMTPKNTNQALAKALEKLDGGYL